MRKRDIISIIKADERIEYNEKLLATVKSRNHHEKPEDYWYPNIPELKPYFDILKKEIISKKEETEKAKKIISNTTCTHEVRIKHHSLLGVTYECVICHHTPSSSFFTSSYIHNHTVTFKEKYEYDEYGGAYEIQDGKTVLEVRKIIMQILEKYEDDDEIDLVKEFEKLKLENIEINNKKRKEENYILIIGGTNLEYLEEDTYITKKNTQNSTTIFEYFLSILNTKIAYVERGEIIDNLNYKSPKVFLKSYETKKQLNNILKRLENIPFKIIIDISQIYDYEIEKLKIKEYNLNLKELFPHSKIIKITTNSKKEIESLLIEMLSDHDFPVIEKNETYFYIDEGKVIPETKTNTLSKIKKMIKN